MLTNEKIPDFVLTGLFPDSLVIIDTEKNLSKHISGDKGSQLPISSKENVVNGQDSPDKKFWLGDNIQKITLLVHDPDNIHISDGNLDFLGKILSACQFNLADVALINIARTPILLEDIRAKLSPKYLIFFNCKQSHIGAKDDLKLYQPDRKNGCTFLLASSLTKMNDGSADAKQEKQRFWISLKQIFGI